jgi:hypothetical protein
MPRTLKFGKRPDLEMTELWTAVTSTGLTAFLMWLYAKTLHPLGFACAKKSSTSFVIAFW